MKFQINFIENQSVLMKMAFAIFIITFFILFIFEPFGDTTHGFLLIGIVRLLSYAFTASMTFYLAERYVKPSFKEWSLTSIYLPVYWYLFEIIIVAVTIFFCRTLWVGFDKTTFGSFFLVLYRVIVIAIIPFAFVMLLVYNSSKNSKIIFKSNDKNPEYLKFPQDLVLYLKSDENYTSIFFKDDNDNVASKILRGSLSYFEASLNFSFIRIHRSYIVNINAIKHVDINSQGGKIVLNLDNIELRVSRKYATSFKTEWQKLNTTN